MGGQKWQITKTLIISRGQNSLQTVNKEMKQSNDKYFQKDN